MPGQDSTGFSPFLGSMENLDGDKKQRMEEIEARIAAMEEQEKLLEKNKESLLNDIQNRLRQELERAGLVKQGENDE